MSAETMAASVVSLMMLAARSGAPRRFDASAQKTARTALAQLLAVRLGEDS
jgi:phosphotransferase system HPr-like phosphotransfer protein